MNEVGVVFISSVELSVALVASVVFNCNVWLDVADAATPVRPPLRTVRFSGAGPSNSSTASLSR